MTILRQDFQLSKTEVKKHFQKLKFQSGEVVIELYKISNIMFEIIFFSFRNDALCTLSTLL